MKYIDLNGKIFGRWIVLNADNSDCHGTKRWWCQCSCPKGIVKSIRSACLRNGTSTSCGCIASENVRRRNIREPFRWLYTKLKITARTNQIPIDLTFDEFLSFTKITQCTYCERQINWPSHGPQKLIENKEIRRAYYLDRKDNKRGYNLDNLCVCCSFCNMIKKDWLTYEEMLLLGKGLKEIRLKRQSA